MSDTFKIGDLVTGRHSGIDKEWQFDVGIVRKIYVGSHCEIEFLSPRGVSTVVGGKNYYINRGIKYYSPPEVLKGFEE